jgi:hypothetical protein
MTDLDYHEPVARLLGLGRPDFPWPDYPQRYGLTAEHIPELIRMATDARIWEETGEAPQV